jgi:hypothetical protein
LQCWDSVGGYLLEGTHYGEVPGSWKIFGLRNLGIQRISRAVAAGDGLSWQVGRFVFEVSVTCVRQ